MFVPLLYARGVKTLTILRGSAGSSDRWLLANAVSTKVSRATFTSNCSNILTTKSNFTLLIYIPLRGTGE